MTVSLGATSGSPRAMRTGGLPRELAELADHIEGVARDSGLDFNEVQFEFVAASEVNGLASYGGFPVRYPSWRFGMEYERLEKGYKWGGSKIYELVINNDPVYAYLVRSNSRLEQKLVMAHVFGHADFFKHNRWFEPTERHMLDTMGRHSARVRSLIDIHGLERIETFLDLALSVDTLIDPYLPLREYLSAGAENGSSGDGPRCVASSQLPTYDILGFLLEEAPLQPLEREILRIVRSEAYYFQPQRTTKIMNEGWASFWHSRILTGGVLDVSEIVDFADCHSAATLQSQGQINPYKVGIELFRYAEEKGRDLFHLRRVHSDTGFVDELMDEEFVERHRLFLFGRNPRSGRTEVLDRDWGQVKRRILQDLSFGGLPQIELVGRGSGSRRELVLRHHHDGRDLQLAMAGETLRNLGALWKAPVVLLTLEEDQGRRIEVRDGKVEATEYDVESDSAFEGTVGQVPT